VITLPVSDVDRAMRFYVDRVGFTLDVDYAPTDAFRVVQLTPPGSSCSVQIGIGLTEEPAGSVRNIYLVVADLEAARSQLLERGVEVGEIRHKTPIGGWGGGFAPGLDPTGGLRELRRLFGSRRQQLDVAGARVSDGVTRM
jgi:predicted enzyme related to lactoylglutathione lyase